MASSLPPAGPFKNFPQITVYHNSNSTDKRGSSQGYTYANIGWTGWIGSITGISENRLGISGIGGSFPDDTFGTVRLCQFFALRASCSIAMVALVQARSLALAFLSR